MQCMSILFGYTNAHTPPLHPAFPSFMRTFTSIEKGAMLLYWSRYAPLLVAIRISIGRGHEPILLRLPTYTASDPLAR